MNQKTAGRERARLRQAHAVYQLSEPQIAAHRVEAPLMHQGQSQDAVVSTEVGSIVTARSRCCVEGSQRRDCCIM